jgi:acetyltransferase-like isoleucine patch superfamily enzyme
MNQHLESVIRGKINAEEVIIGKGVVVEDNVLITGTNGPAKKVVLGDFCFIGHNSKIITPEFRLGDYTKLHMHAFGHGTLPLQIGRNCWFGGNMVLDSNGGLDIDDNVGMGAQTQVWTHIQCGDIVEGCRFYSSRYMHIEKDVWLVGHCILSPVKVGERSMALVGSVITRDMLPNHTYAGVPAVDVTEKVGPQFASRTIEEKAAKLQELIAEFEAQFPQHRDKIQVILSNDEIKEDLCCINITDRTYTKTYSEAEVAFFKKYVPLVKFTPMGEGSFIELQKPENP